MMWMRSVCLVLDTLSLARERHPGQRNNLDALCKRYGIDNSHRELHGALLDALTVRQRKGDQLTAEDMWCNYHGPIGYAALDGKPSWDGHPIREQEGLYQNSHLAPAAFHAVIYDNVSIHLRN